MNPDLAAPTPCPDVPRRRVLVLGANGRFGAAAAQAFDRAGWQVLAQVRRAAAPGLPASATLVRAALADTEALVRAAAPVDVVVHACNPPYTEWQSQLLPMARAGMDAAERLGARFVLPGNVYNFGADMPASLTEDTAFAPTTPKGQWRVALEAEMRRRAPGLRSLVLRAGDFFGGGRGNWFDQAIVKSLPSGKLVYPGPLDRTHAWTYLPDMADTLVALCERATLPDVAVVHAPSIALTGAQLLQGLEDAAHRLGIAGGRALRRGTLPWGFIRLAGVVVPMWRALAEMSYLWRVPHRLDSVRLQALLPGHRVTPLPEALARSLCELGLAPRRPATA